MEFLIDRYGYLRARWIPAVDGSGWTDIGELMRQIDQLNREKEIRRQTTMCTEPQPQQLHADKPSVRAVELASNLRWDQDRIAGDHQTVSHAIGTH